MAKRNSILPSIAHLHECFILSDGALTWKQRPESHFPSARISKVINRRNGGKPAGSIRKDGYLAVGVGQEKTELAHRVIFAMTHGRWPDGILDHVDGNRLNNRPENLREATHATNAANTPAMPHNASGHKGVHLQPQTGRWRAQIKHKKRTEHLGYFDTPELAAKAYERAAERMQGQFAFHVSRSQS